jgi:hypothetical protein
MSTLMRYIIKMFWILGINQLWVSWMQGNFPIKKFGTSYWIPVVSMYCEKLKEAWAEVASNEVSPMWR